MKIHFRKSFWKNSMKYRNLSLFYKHYQMNCIQMDGFDYKVNDLFSEDFIKEIKEELQMQDGVKLSSHKAGGKLTISCIFANFQQCPYTCMFSREQRSECQYAYRLVSLNRNHSKNCFDFDQAQFLRDIGELRNLRQSFANIIHSMLLKGEKVGQPTELMPFISLQIFGRQNYFQEMIQKYTLNQDPLRRCSIKKKIDNIISQCKNNIPNQIAQKYSQQQLNLLLGKPEDSSHSRRKKNRYSVKKIKKEEQEDSDSIKDPEKKQKQTQAKNPKTKSIQKISKFKKVLNFD